MKILFLCLIAFSFKAFSNPCESDQKKFCANITPGKGQIARCLNDYQGQLSKSCADELKKFKKETVKKNPCFDEMAEFCSDIPSDPRNYEYCLLKHESRLGPTCSADFKKKKGNIIVKNVCAQDIVNHCYTELDAPEGSINRCLIRNRTKLSGFCQKKTDKRIAELRKRNPCFDDTEKFCPDAIKFIDIQDCLSKKVTSLSPTCKMLVNKEEEKMKANPCYRDLITHCRPGISPKEQTDCLTLNENHLGNACRQFRAVESVKINKMVEVCEKDRLKLCPKTPFKNGEVAKCLRKNKAQLSPQCKSLF